MQRNWCRLDQRSDVARAVRDPCGREDFGARRGYRATNRYSTLSVPPVAPAARLIVARTLLYQGVYQCAATTKELVQWRATNARADTPPSRRTGDRGGSAFTGVPSYATLAGSRARSQITCLLQPTAQDAYAPPMRVWVVPAVVVALVVAPAPASATPKTKFCGAHTYTYTPKKNAAKKRVLLNVFASRSVMCTFARRHARASYQRGRCAKGWRYKRVSPNSFCTRKGRIYFAIRLRT